MRKTVLLLVSVALAMTIVATGGSDTQTPPQQELTSRRSRHADKARSAVLTSRRRRRAGTWGESKAELFGAALELHGSAPVAGGPAVGGRDAEGRLSLERFAAGWGTMGFGEVGLCSG